MKILRLLLFSECDRNCLGCCNNDWNLQNLPIVDSYSNYDEIILTGGEPLLRPELIKQTILNIRKETNSPIYLYTAKTDNIINFLDILQVVDGITVTLHNQQDVKIFKILNNFLGDIQLKNKSLRLNIFKGINLDNINVNKWIVKDNMVWIKNCPLPRNEVFMRLNTIYE